MFDLFDITNDFFSFNHLINSLTWCENKVFDRNLSEYHTGLRAYSRRFLDEIAWYENSNNFVFDTEIVAQAVARRFHIAELMEQLNG